MRWMFLCFMKCKFRNKLLRLDWLLWQYWATLQAATTPAVVRRKRWRARGTSKSDAVKRVEMLKYPCGSVARRLETWSWCLACHFLGKKRCPRLHHLWFHQLWAQRLEKKWWQEWPGLWITVFSRLLSEFHIFWSMPACHKFPQQKKTRNITKYSEWSEWIVESKMRSNRSKVSGPYALLAICTSLFREDFGHFAGNIETSQAEARRR